MNNKFSRSAVEQLKQQLQHSVQKVLTGTEPTPDDAEIITRIMSYIVSSHDPNIEQFYRIQEYLLVMDALHKKYHDTKPVKRSVSTDCMAPMFSGNELPF